MRAARFALDTLTLVLSIGTLAYVGAFLLTVILEGR